MKEKLKLFDRTDLLDEKFFDVQSDAIMDGIRSLEKARACVRYSKMPTFLESKVGSEALSQSGLTRGMGPTSSMGLMLFKVRK